MQLADKVRSDVLLSMYQGRVEKLRGELEEVKDDESVRANIEQRIKLVNHQMKVIERYLNSCIFERIQGEQRFRWLRKVLPRMQARLEAAF